MSVTRGRLVWLTGGICSGKSSARAFLGLLGAHTVDADVIGHSIYLPGTQCYEEVVAAFGSGVVGDDGTIDRKALGTLVFADPRQRSALEAIVWPHIGKSLSEEVAAATRLGHVRSQIQVAGFGESVSEARGKTVARLEAMIAPHESRMTELIALCDTEDGPAATAEAKALWSEHCGVAFDTQGEPLVAVEAAVLVEAGWNSQGGSVWSTFVDRERAIERMQSSRGASREQAEARLAAQLEVVDRLRAADVGIDSSGSKCRTWAQLLVALRDLEPFEKRA